jgi:hypothetical protein
MIFVHISWLSSLLWGVNPLDKDHESIYILARTLYKHDTQIMKELMKSVQVMKSTKDSPKIDTSSMYKLVCTQLNKSVLKKK